MRFAAACLVMLFAAACAKAAPPPATPAPQQGGAPGATAAPAASCPSSVTESAGQQGGSCLEAAVLGQDVVASCVTWFESQGWVHDTDAETAIGGQTGKQLTCYHAP
jgi:hypothetical protein